MYARIQNDQSVLMNGVTLLGTITDPSEKKTFATLNMSDRGIMPNTNFDVVYELLDGELKPGEYLLNLKITHEAYSWEWKETLNVTKEEAQDINEGAVFMEKKTNWFLIIMIGLLLCILLFLIIILYKRRKKDREEK